MTLKNENKTERDSTGRFRGAGAYVSSMPPHTTAFAPIGDVADVLGHAMDNADFLLGTSSTGDAGVQTVAVRGSPGSGKSTLQRRRMADRVNAGATDMVAFHVPTLALAEDAAYEATELGIDASAVRGRSANRLDGQGTMCAKADLVEKASRIGISVRDNFCERKEENGTVRRCPHFENCAYLNQFTGTATHRFLASTYLGLPDPSGTKFNYRVVDETFWREFIRIRDVEAAVFAAPRTFMSAKRTGEHADVLVAAKDVFAALVSGKSPLALPYTSDDYEGFAKLEWEAMPPSADLAPDHDCKKQQTALLKAEQNFRQVASFSAIWSVLAEAAANGRAVCERVRLYETQGRHMIRVMKTRKLVHSEPILVLDADADDEILAAIGCQVLNQHDVILRPNAFVRQIHDNRMCTTSLINKVQIRQKWREIIAKEVLIDRRAGSSGVLVGASRKVVQAFFRDAGYNFEAMTDSEASKMMLETKLHGVHWLWFGSRALGSNRYKNCSSVIIIGREELPTQALEDMGTALWGDTPNAELNLIQPDDKGNKWLPDLEVPYLMSDGSPMAVNVPCHPDLRIRRVQMQTRELATRQLIERLRLARSAYPKRVLIGCNIPIPNVPVDQLLSCEELFLNRVEAAIVVGLLDKGQVRLTHQGLHEAAPSVFRSLDAVKSCLKRNASGAAIMARCKSVCSNTGRIKTLNWTDFEAIAAVTH